MTVGDNIALLMIQFLVYVARLVDMKKLPIKVATYLLKGITKYYLEEFSKTFDMMLHQERIKQLST